MKKKRKNEDTCCTGYTSLLLVFQCLRCLTVSGHPVISLPFLTATVGSSYLREFNGDLSYKYVRPHSIIRHVSKKSPNNMLMGPLCMLWGTFIRLALVPSPAPVVQRENLAGPESLGLISVSVAWHTAANTYFKTGWI